MMVTKTTTIRIPTAERDDGDDVRAIILAATGKKLTHQDFYRLGKRYAVIQAHIEAGHPAATGRQQVKSTLPGKKGNVYDLH